MLPNLGPCQTKLAHYHRQGLVAALTDKTKSQVDNFSTIGDNTAIEKFTTTKRFANAAKRYPSLKKFVCCPPIDGGIETIWQMLSVNEDFFDKYTDSAVLDIISEACNGDEDTDLMELLDDGLRSGMLKLATTTIKAVYPFFIEGDITSNEAR